MFKDIFAFYLSNYCTDIKINSLEEKLQWKHKSSSRDVKNIMKLQSYFAVTASHRFYEEHKKTLTHVCMLLTEKK